MQNKDGSPRERWQCTCGSGESGEKIHDGYGIYLLTVCVSCRPEKMPRGQPAGYRADIFESYDCDEPIDGEPEVGR